MVVAAERLVCDALHSLPADPATCFRHPLMRAHTHKHTHKTHTAESVYDVVLQKSIPTQIRQLILYISNSQGSVDGFVRELTSAERLSKTFV